MNIVGEGFNPIIIGQIKKRQEIYGSVNKDNEQLNYINNKTGWCRLASSVEVIQLPQNRNIPSSGINLAKDFILFNGTSKLNNQLRGGVWPGTDDFNNSAYGVGGTSFGLRPMPGIIQATIKTETRGSLKTATINVKANSKEQFDIIDILYLRLGYSMLLEWGSSSYYDNKKGYISDNPNSLINDFFENNITYANYPEKINEQRLNSCGNYDAIIGKVVNFNWTFTKEGTYDITIILRSMGDVIESLKTNILLPNTQNSFNGVSSSSINVTPSSTPNKTYTPLTPNLNSPSPNDENEVINPQTISNEIGKEFYKLQKELSKAPKPPQTETTYSSDNINVDAFKKIYYGDTSITAYYVRLGYFLKFIQSTLIPIIDNKVDTPLLKIDTDIESNIIYLLARQISTNPGICIFKRDIKGTSGEVYNFFTSLNSFITGKNTNSYGKIMNAYFNMDWILTSMDSLKDEKGNVSLYSLLNLLCGGWNQSTGNFNKLEPIVDDDENIIRIIDQLSLPDRIGWLDDPIINKSSQLAKFNVYLNGNNNGSFVKDISFNTTVPPNLASMITIGATSKGYVVGQDSTALSRMNAGLEDRFKKTITNGNLDVGKEDQGDTALPTNFINVYNTFDIFLKSLSENKWNQEAINAFTDIASTFYEYDQAYQSESLSELEKLAIEAQNALPNNTFVSGGAVTLKKNPIKSSSSTIGFLPFDLQLVISGLSGMKVYQMYTITSEFLPSNYPESLEFLIKGITHTIQNNEWSTTIESISVPKNVNGSTYGDTSLSNASSNFLPPNNLTTSVTTDQTARDIIRFFTSKGLGKVQASGIAGNLFAESSFRPNVLNVSGGNIGSYGLAQWRGSRQQELLNFAQNRGESKGNLSITTQLEFILKEFNTTEGLAFSDLKQQTTIEGAAISFGTKYERFNQNDRSLPRRIAFSKKFFNL